MSEMPLEIWTDVNGNAARTQFKGGVKYIRADEVARLRDALKTYAECSDGCTCGDGWSHDPAKAALTPQAGKGGVRE